MPDPPGDTKTTGPSDKAGEPKVEGATAASAANAMRKEGNNEARPPQSPSTAALPGLELSADNTVGKSGDGSQPRSRQPAVGDKIDWHGRVPTVVGTADGGVIVSAPKISDGASIAVGADGPSPAVYPKIICNINGKDTTLYRIGPNSPVVAELEPNSNLLRVRRDLKILPVDQLKIADPGAKDNFSDSSGVATRPRAPANKSEIVAELGDNVIVRQKGISQEGGWPIGSAANVAKMFEAITVASNGGEETLYRPKGNTKMPTLFRYDEAERRLSVVTDLKIVARDSDVARDAAAVIPAFKKGIGAYGANDGTITSAELPAASTAPEFGRTADGGRDVLTQRAISTHSSSERERGSSGAEPGGESVANRPPEQHRSSSESVDRLGPGHTEVTDVHGKPAEGGKPGDKAGGAMGIALVGLSLAAWYESYKASHTQAPRSKPPISN